MSVKSNTLIHLQQSRDTIIREGINVDYIEIQAVSSNWQGTSGLFQKENGDWQLIIETKVPEEWNEKSQTIYKAFLVEQYRIRLAIALQEYSSTAYGSEVMRKFSDHNEDVDNQLQQTLTYYLPYKQDIRQDVQLLSQMLKDIFNVRTTIHTKAENHYKSGATLRSLILGRFLCVGGKAQLAQQQLVCTFHPQNQQESLLFFLGGIYYSFLHQIVFRHFVDSAYSPLIKVAPLSQENVTVGSHGRLGVHEMLIQKMYY